MVTFSEFSSGTLEGPLNAIEAERIIDSLQCIDIADIGSKKWIKQKEFVEQLNIQAHQNVMLNHDEFVTAGLLSFSKVPVLIQELITIELWKSRVEPLIREEMIAAHKASLKPYNLLYYEAILANLLECVFYYKDAVLTSEDCLIDLLDYCQRKVCLLTTLPDDKRGLKAVPTGAAEMAKQLMEQSDQDRFEEHRRDIEFSSAIFSLTVLRYIVDNVNELPPGAVSRMLDDHDLVVSLVYLIERAPWKRRGRDGYQKFIGNRWVVVKPDEILKLTQSEAQVWLMLYTLLLDNETRKKYEINSFRRDTITKLKKYMNEVLIDQIPLLVDLQRVVEELLITNAPPPTVRSTLLLVEQVPIIRDRLLKQTDFEKVAQSQALKLFDEDEESKRQEMLRLSKLFEQYSDLLQADSAEDTETIGINTKGK